MQESTDIIPIVSITFYKLLVQFFLTDLYLGIGSGGLGHSGITGRTSVVPTVSGVEISKVQHRLPSHCVPNLIRLSRQVHTSES